MRFLALVAAVLLGWPHPAGRAAGKAEHVVLVVWEVVYLLGVKPEVMLPSPAAVFDELLRLLQGGLDKQTAILPLIGQLKLTVLEAEMLPNTSPVVVGRELADAADARPLSFALPTRQACGCWALPCREGL